MYCICVCIMCIMYMYRILMYMNMYIDMYVISHPGHQRSQFPSDQWNGGTLCPFCPYFNSSGSCSLGGRSLCLEWASVYKFRLHCDCIPWQVHSDAFYSNLKTTLF